MNYANDNYLAVLLEEIRSQNKGLFEAVSSMQRHVAKIPQIQTEIQHLQHDMRAIKDITDPVHQDHNRKRRAGRPEVTA